MVAAALSLVVSKHLPAVKLLPSAFDLCSIQVGGDFSPEGGGFAQDRTKPAEFLAPLTAFFT